mmetsp:Transcript_13845/g.14986  ORF Transcript_13845/g.14986 Transcript_13845/m.14986 type:complete len:103 (-) Transcript_13845:102-410(-)
MLALEEETVITNATPTMAAATTTTTIVFVIAEYWSNLMYDTNFIVGPTVSTYLTTVAVAPTISMVTKMPQSTLIKWVDGKRTHHIGVGLSPLEALGGGVRVT